MTLQKRQHITAAAIVAGVIIIDQIIKFLIKTRFYLHESKRITSWFYLHFTENNGMAFGMELTGKIFLTVFRLLAVAAISWFLYHAIKRGAKTGFVICMAMIVAGAFGNIVDCVLYGQIFSESLPQGYPGACLAHLVPFGEGYQSLLQGKVVDMFYFPFFSFTWPDSLPLVGGSEFEFFGPVFNFADASISVGVFFLILCYRKSLNEHFNAK